MLFSFKIEYFCLSQIILIFKTLHSNIIYLIIVCLGFFFWHTLKCDTWCLNSGCDGQMAWCQFWLGWADGLVPVLAGMGSWIRSSCRAAEGTLDRRWRTSLSQALDTSTRVFCMGLRFLVCEMMVYNWMFSQLQKVTVHNQQIQGCLSTHHQYVAKHSRWLPLSLPLLPCFQP